MSWPFTTGDLVSAADINNIFPQDRPYSTWTPSWSNLSPGNGLVVARYFQFGATVHAYVSVDFGSTTSISGDVSITNMPVATNIGSNDLTSARNIVGQAKFVDAGVNTYYGHLAFSTTTTLRIRAFGTASSVVDDVQLSSTVPFSWTGNDRLIISAVYEAA